MEGSWSVVEEKGVGGGRSDYNGGRVLDEAKNTREKEMSLEMGLWRPQIVCFSR